MTQLSVTYHLQHSTEQSKDERVNEWMLFNFKYRYNITFIERRCVLK